MEWEDEGIVLGSRPLGERDAMASLMTFEHGRHAGLVRGGLGRQARPLLQAGNRLQCIWKARLEDHLGTFAIEPIRLWSSVMLDRPLVLAALNAATGLIDAGLAEREPHPVLYAALLRLVEALGEDDPEWPARFVRFEMLVLQELGAGLDLSACAVTGATTGLAYVSPRSGRAVTREAGAPYADKLLRLPPFLLADETAGANDIADGLRLAGYFLDRHIFAPADRLMPAARDRFVQAWQQHFPTETS